MIKVHRRALSHARARARLPPCLCAHARARSRTLFAHTHMARTHARTHASTRVAAGGIHHQRRHEGRARHGNQVMHSSRGARPHAEVSPHSDLRLARHGAPFEGIYYYQAAAEGPGRKFAKETRLCPEASFGTGDSERRATATQALDRERKLETKAGLTCRGSPGALTSRAATPSRTGHGAPPGPSNAAVEIPWLTAPPRNSAEGSQAAYRPR